MLDHENQVQENLLLQEYATVIFAIAKGGGLTSCTGVGVRVLYKGPI